MTRAQSCADPDREYDAGRPAARHTGGADAAWEPLIC